MLKTSLPPQPHLYMGDAAGRPLDYGQVFFGEPDKDPEFYPIDIYYDEALTIPAMQPVRTKGGFLNANGDMVEVYANEFEYSLKVLDQYGRKVFYKPRMSRTSVDSMINSRLPYPNAVTRTQAERNAEVISLLDFGAPYSKDSTIHLQKAIDTLHDLGGGILQVPYHTGTLVISGHIDLRPNVIINCAENLVVDCSAYTDQSSQFELIGSIGDEIPLNAHKTSGDTKISLTRAHGLKVGDDFLIVSQRQCAHADAGERWQLGETTGNGKSPYFAEPLVVESVPYVTGIVAQTPLIFPDYRTDKTREKSPNARDSSTVQKINFLSNFKWRGGIFKKNEGRLFDLKWTKYCEIDIQIERGYGSGEDVYNIYSLKNKIKLKVTRPIDWALETDHSAYNSVKDVSSWYSDIELDEENGCQGLDQTYQLYCSIYPHYKVRHVNSREDAMTTHGNSYGAIIDVYAVNCENAALRNRARFVTANVRSVNCGWGLRNSTYGTLDCNFDLYCLDCSKNVVSFMSEGVTQVTPAVKNSRISGVVTMAPNSTGTAVYFGENINVDDKYKDSQLKLVDLSIKSTGRAIVAMGHVNGVVIDNVYIDYFGTASPIWLRYSAGHSISNFTADYKNGDGKEPAIFASPFPDSAESVKKYGSSVINIDYDTCKVINGTLITNDDRFIASKNVLSGSSSEVSIIELNSKNIARLVKIDVYQGGRSENRIVLSNTIPLGYEFDVLLTTRRSGNVVGFYGDTSETTIDFANTHEDVEDNFVTLYIMRQFRVKKTGDNEFVIA